MNLCTGCGLDFGSVEAFDRHRVGKYPQTGPSEWSSRVRAGLVDPYAEWKPTVEFGRRCLDEEELTASAKFSKNTRGQWSLTKGLEAGNRLRRVRAEAV